MKCEICKKGKAEVAIQRPGSTDDDDELYVCKACADQERRRRQKKSQRTRKVTGLPPGISMSVTEIHGPGDETSEGGEGDGDAPPPIIGAIMSAFSDMAHDLEQVADKIKQDKEKGSEKPKLLEFPLSHVDHAYLYGGGLHLEGLHLIGELEAVQRGVVALGYEFDCLDSDGVKASGHVYRLRYSGQTDRASRVIEAIVAQERNARVRLFEEMPRVFGDSLCRALSILKNCRLLAPGELFDLLSPLRLAALEKMLDGIDITQIEKLADSLDLTNTEDTFDQDERDRVDAERADAMNERFEDVVLNERAEGEFL